jgi:branched-chain amino acid transport system ATP-binding protein
MLELQHVTSGYGTVPAISNINISVPQGACVCLIGANGAGKTTTLLTISGLVRAFSGHIKIDGVDHTTTSADRIVRSGVSLVPEGRRVIASMSVADNLLIGAYVRKNGPEISIDMRAVYDRFPRLFERRRHYAGSLSGGEQQMLAIGRALMARPRLLLLDEPSMGLAPHVVREIFETIQEINKQGTTILLVEQNARKALSIANYGYVLEKGKIAAEGPTEQLRNTDSVKDAYLGMGQAMESTSQAAPG